MPHSTNYQALRSLLNLVTDADGVLLRGLPLKQAKESLMIIGLLHSQAQNKSPLAWITREFREMIVIAPELLNGRLHRGSLKPR